MYSLRPRTIGSFRNRVALTHPGSREQLTIVRDGRRQNFEVTIGMLGKAARLARGSAQSTPELGLTVQTLIPELVEQFDANPGEGVVVTAVQARSIAATAGIKSGTVILEVNRKRLTNVAEFKRAIAESDETKRVHC